MFVPPAANAATGWHGSTTTPKAADVSASSTPPALAESLRQGSYSVGNDAGHYVPLERPERLATIVGQAMDQLPNHP